MATSFGWRFSGGSQNPDCCSFSTSGRRETGGECEIVGDIRMMTEEKGLLFEMSLDERQMLKLVRAGLLVCVVVVLVVMVLVMMVFLGAKSLASYLVRFKPLTTNVPII